MASAGPLRQATTVWRRSIQARVVISTLLLCAIVVTLVGWVLLHQITAGLVRSKTASSVAEATRATADAQGRLSAASGNDFDSRVQITQLVSSLVSRGDVQGYEIVLTGPITGAGADSGVSSTPGVLASSIPARLRSEVVSGAADRTSYTFSTIRYAAATGQPPVPGVVTGSQVMLPADGGTYTLYYLFPMTEQESTLSLVRRALETGGALLLLMVGGVTWMVTRQVVTPVRLARRVAERLASGRLEERMHVRGDDDIARLGTSFNQMADSLQKQIRQLEELSRVQRRFVSDVSHELRTPLTTVRMAGDVLHDARSRFDPSTARAAELLQKELDRFELLLSDLLEISRFDAGAAVLDLEDVDVTEIARRVVESTRALAERRGISVVVRAADEPCLAEADGRRVERIVRNLVTNAIDYAESDDVIVLVASGAEATALAVRDYGVGLKPGEASMVFNRFWRADPARARTSGGTGLGLSISLEDAHLHGGWLQAWGEPGNGAQFRLTLPRLAGEVFTSSPLPLVPEDAAVARISDRRTAGRGRGRALMSPRTRRRTALTALLAAITLVLSGCVSVPRSGSVTSVTVQDTGDGDTLVDYTPAGPRRGSAPVPLVQSFLTSMTATPLSTSVARRFLTGEAARSWDPEQGTVSYGSAQLSRGRDGRVRLLLRDVTELDARGTWLGDPTRGSGHDYALRLVQDGGQWRIARLPDRLLVPRAHFERQYQQLLLYYVDPAARVLVPEPVFLPRGRQAATLLVSGLLKGPEPYLAGTEQTFFPPGAALAGLSVPVSRDGTAEVPLNDEVLEVSPARLSRMLAQLAWTLGQIRG